MNKDKIEELKKRIAELKSKADNKMTQEELDNYRIEMVKLDKEIEKLQTKDK